MAVGAATSAVGVASLAVGVVSVSLESVEATTSRSPRVWFTMYTTLPLYVMKSCDSHVIPVLTYAAMARSVREGEGEKERE